MSGNNDCFSNIIEAAKYAIDNENYDGCMFFSLVIPDICSLVMFPELSPFERNSVWFHENLGRYDNFLSGADFFALQYEYLNNASVDISRSVYRDQVSLFVFIPDSSRSCHCNMIGRERVLLLNVYIFLEDIISAAQKIFYDKSLRQLADEKSKIILMNRYRQENEISKMVNKCDDGVFDIISIKPSFLGVGVDMVKLAKKFRKYF